MIKFLTIILLISFFLISCNNEITDNPIANQPPDTGLFLYPDSSISSQPSKINIHWWGDDPDGIVVGYYYTWNGTDWSVTRSNNILFALQIGAKDTAYTFMVAAVDNSGNGIYDSQISQNGINFGPEPFVDANANGSYDAGETFFDIGLIDPTPASFDFPIKNSAPTIFWNKLSFLPDTSFPVMSFGWEAEDIDGNESIQNINIALNDTSNPANVISLNGSIRRVTLRTKEFDSQSPMMEILIDGSPSNINQEKLPGLKFNDNNKLYVQAVDISGAKSNFIVLPDTNKHWFVKKPAGKLLIVDDYAVSDNAASFYNSAFNEIGLANKFDNFNFKTQSPPYINVTFLETLKLFDYVFWYSDNNPSLDLASIATQKYLDNGGKIAFSLQFPQTVDLTLISSFLPVNSDSGSFRTSLLAGTKISSDSTQPAYPNLELSSGIFRARAFFINALAAIPIYYFPNKELDGFVGLSSIDKKLFFIGVPLHKSNGGNANVKNLLEKVFIGDFGLTL